MLTQRSEEVEKKNFKKESRHSIKFTHMFFIKSEKKKVNLLVSLLFVLALVMSSVELRQDNLFFTKAMNTDTIAESISLDQAGILPLFHFLWIGILDGDRENDEAYLFILGWQV
jgi:hypothetical protein